MNSKLPTYLNKRQIIQRGWTEKTLARLLGSPDVQKAHPESGKMVSFWKTKDVLDQESSKAWQSWKKRKQLLELVERSNVSVNKMEMDAIKFAAVNGYNHLHAGKPDFRFATVDSDAQFLDRIVVNYLRHQQTNYDASLKVISHQVGREQAYALLKNKVLAAIAYMYPSLHDECVRQRVSIQDVLSRL